MKVLHIIPAAFHYFDDIRDAAFAAVDKLGALGVEAEVFTLQYGGNPGSPKSRSAVKAVAPGQEYKETVGLKSMAESFSQFDIIHLHAPFLGAAGAIRKFKERNPAAPFVITYYHPFEAADLFGYYIKWYNHYHLRKLFALADWVFKPATLSPTLIASDYERVYTDFTVKKETGSS